MATQTLDAKIDEVLAAVRSQANDIQTLTDLNREKSEMLRRAADSLQAGLDREAALMDALTAARERESSYQAAIEAALRHFRLAPFAYDSADGWAAHHRLVKELESLL